MKSGVFGETDSRPETSKRHDTDVNFKSDTTKTKLKFSGEMDTRPNSEGTVKRPSFIDSNVPKEANVGRKGGSMSY